MTVQELLRFIRDARPDREVVTYCEHGGAHHPIISMRVDNQNQLVLTPSDRWIDRKDGS